MQSHAASTRSRIVVSTGVLLLALAASAGALEVISRSPSGKIGSSDSKYPIVSGNGRYVLWASYAKSKRTLGAVVEPIPDPVTGKFPKGDSDKLALVCLPAP